MAVVVGFHCDCCLLAIPVQVAVVVGFHCDVTTLQRQLPVALLARHPGTEVVDFHYDVTTLQRHPSVALLARHPGMTVVVGFHCDGYLLAIPVRLLHGCAAPFIGRTRKQFAVGQGLWSDRLCCYALAALARS